VFVQKGRHASDGTELSVLPSRGVKGRDVTI